VDILATEQGSPSILLARAGDAATEPSMARAEAAGAWRAWRTAVDSMDPDQIIGLVSEAGLRGRGGAGFPTGSKWRACADQPGRERFVVANGFEADPGAQLDRTLMERDPHAVVEGVALAAYAVGAHQAYICLRPSATVAVRRLRETIRAAEEQGLLGTAVLDSGFDLHVEVREISGSFVVGEETVLLRALENRRAQPDQRPPYPTESGLWGKPTVVNNVETLAAVPWLMAQGAQAFQAVGAEGMAGTTLIQVTGAVARPGIAEVPMGSSVGSILGLAGVAGTAKAVLVGGPSGGLLPPSEFDLPMTPERLARSGAIWGSGSLVVVDERTCLVDLSALMTRYLNDEACGKTIPCRIGLRRLAEIGERMMTGHPRPTDPELLADLAADTRAAALCALESSATNPLLSGMRYFGPEFQDHIVRGVCPAGVCQPIRVAAGAAS